MHDERTPSAARAPTILVADDELYIRRLLTQKLTEAGLNVVAAADAPAAVELARQHLPDLMVVDYRMPGGTGMDVIRTLREDPRTRTIPAIMLTARAYLIPREELDSIAILGLIAKPFSMRDLLRRVESVVRPTGGGQQAAA
jgi:two-component system phosphate regulon response regulator PhoB